MPASRAEIGFCFDRILPPTLVVDVARRLEAGGADRMWVIEDCFYTAGVSLASAALVTTERLGVGLGILPAVARNPAVTAMEIATLAGLAPDRLDAGIGHGVQDWMAQMGARTPSPVTTLEEVLVAVRRLLAGERVTMHGRYVHLDDVQLDQPPPSPPRLLAGVRGPKSLAMAGRAADGVVLAEPASPSYVRWARDQAGNPPGFHVAVFGALCIDADRATAYQRMAPWIAERLDPPSAGFQVLPFFDDLVARHKEQGNDGLVTMPSDWWTELGPIGTPDDAAAHIEALEAAGVDSIGLYPKPRVSESEPRVDELLALVTLLR
ncbi:MAG: LLM class flavin-dependent oxidoreductase [Acidimicrobiales bacterium]